MDVNGVDSGSRVTRSLRKRLTSIDSDNSSRPGTPLSTKLTSITEIASSPTRATRSTRRNSTTGVATPVKTPAKRVISSSIVADHSESLTPARRSTRRRSISTTENDDHSQTVVKIPTFEILDEEAVQSEEKPKTTKAKSMSPQKDSILKNSPSPKNSSKKRKPGPKSKTQKFSSLENDIEECQSDVEVSVFANKTEGLENPSNNMLVVICTDDDSLTDSQNKNAEGHEIKLPSSSESIIADEGSVSKICQEQIENTLTDVKNLEETSAENAKITMSASTNEAYMKQTKENVHEDNEDKNMNNESVSVGEKNDTLKDDDILEDFFPENTDETSQSTNFENLHDNEKNIYETKNIPGEKNLEEEDFPEVLDIEKGKTGGEPQELPVKEENSEEAKVVLIYDETEIQESSTLTNCISPDVKNSQKVEILSVDTFPANDCEKFSKKVDFTTTPSKDISVKSVYPKTPVATKASSSKVIQDHLEESLSPAECNLEKNDIEMIQENRYEKSSDGGEPEITKSISISEIIHSTSSTELLKNSEIQPTDNEEDVNRDSSKELESNIHKENENTNSTTVIETEISKADAANQEEKDLKWINPSVTGYRVEGSKLDVVLSTTIDQNTENVCLQVRKNKTDFAFLSEDEDEVHQDEKDLIGKETRTQDENEFDEEENSKERNEFIEDEAMEVDNYESGDSMDSEERRDIQNNEVPVDAESIGSHSTDESQNENVGEEEEESYNSFIVSDTEDVEDADSENDCNDYDEEIDEAPKEHKFQKSKKTYKRIQRPTETSSSSDEEREEQKPKQVPKGDDDIKSISESENNIEKANKNDISEPEKGKALYEISTNNTKCPSNSSSGLAEPNSSPNKSRDLINLDSSKLSDSALRLHYTSYSKSDEEDDAEEIHCSRKEILSNLNHSERFNKSVRDLKLDVDGSPLENHNVSEIKLNGEKSKGEHTLSSSEDLNAESQDNIKHSIENQLGEISVTSESDADRANKDKSLDLAKSGNGLSVSFGNFKKRKQKHEWQRSFTIGVTVKDGELETAVTNFASSSDDQEKEVSNVPLLTNLDMETCSSKSIADDQEKEETGKRKIDRENVGDVPSPTNLDMKTLSSTSSVDDHQEKENVETRRQRDNLKNVPLPLGNPLIRVRRQSLALPTNPDMEICSSNCAGPKTKRLERRSLGLFSNIDLKPSQSFIENIEIMKNEQSQLAAKRKRLSKSFGGSTEVHDNSIVDIDIRHLHKKGKLIDENSSVDSDQECEDNRNTSKLFTKLSSTPHERINKTDFSSQRILERCDEILEAANRAKLEAKQRYKKNKTKTSKKRFKKSTSASSAETSPEVKTLSAPKELKIKEKTKTAISQAILAADAILTKTKLPACKNKKVTLKRLETSVIGNPQRSADSKKKIVKENAYQKEKNGNVFATSAGNFIEFPQTPEKKKKKLSYIQLPTGKVSVEPLTPTKHLVEAFNAKSFRESPITPHINFKVKKMYSPENCTASTCLFGTGKRKRSHDESVKEMTGAHAQWTLSGVFKEEVISNQNVSSMKTETRKGGKTSCYDQRNFKENALSRPRVNRPNKRELFKTKERNRDCSTYNSNI